MDEGSESWHLKREVSISQIVAILAVAVSVIVGWQKLNERMSLIELEQRHAEMQDARLENQLRESVVRIEAAVIRIENALRDKQDKKK